MSLTKEENGHLLGGRHHGDTHGVVSDASTIEKGTLIAESQIAAESD